MPMPAGRSTPWSASSLRTSPIASPSTASGPRRMSACGAHSRAITLEPSVGHRDPHRGGAELDADEAQPGVEVDQRRAPSAPRRGGAAVLGQTELDQPSHLGGHGRPRDVQSAGEVHPRERALVTDVGQDPGLGGRLGPAGQHVCHARILPRHRSQFRSDARQKNISRRRGRAPRGTPPPARPASAGGSRPPAPRPRETRSRRAAPRPAGSPRAVTSNGLSGSSFAASTPERDHQGGAAPRPPPTPPGPAPPSSHPSSAVPSASGMFRVAPSPCPLPISSA